MEYKNGGWVDSIDTLLRMSAKPEIVKKYDWRKKINIEYLNMPCAFDIETSSFYTIRRVGKKSEAVKQACMYIWMLGINGNAVYGRTWAEFMETMDKIEKFYNLGEDRRMVVYIHNLAYEFCWFNQYFEWENIFAREKNRPMRANTTNGFEFRCSLMLSGQSLAGTCKDLTKYKVQKMVGDLDYEKIRTSITPVDDTELGYCLNDVLGVMSYVKEEMEEVGDNILNVPMTKTGKVRNYIIDHCLKVRQYKNLVHNCTISGASEYRMMKRAYTGGFTHACNRNVGRVIDNVKSWDFTSSYPAVLIAEPEYPISSGEKCTIHSIEELKELSRHNFVIYNVKFTGLVAKHDWEHYLSASKCYWDNGEKIVPLPDPTKPNKKNPVLIDNGRVVSADQLITTLCHIDWEMIEEYYQWDTVEFGEAYKYRKGYLPKEFIECVLHFYVGKTTLKNVPGMEVEYQLLKGMLNSCYGAVCTDIVSDIIEFESCTWTNRKPDVEEVIEKYNNSKKRWGFWPWAIACTALARRNLFRGITEFGATGDYIYSDTDSVKVTNFENHMEFIERYNKDITKKLYVMCHVYGIDFELTRPKTAEYTDKDGKVHKPEAKPLGIWDDDGFYDKFKTLGAKRYLVEKHGEVTCTIAGSNKKDTSKLLNTLEDPFGFFSDEMTIDEDHSGRRIVAYFYEPCEGDVTDYLGNTYHYHEASYIHIEKGKYSLSISDYYKNYIQSVSTERICL